MTDEVGNLVLEHLRALRAELSTLKDEVRGMRSEETATRFEVRAVNTRVEQLLEDSASVKVRLDRIETRLGLLDSVK